MSRSLTLGLLTASLLTVSASPASAQQPAGPPRLSPGTQIYVTDTEGLERKYRFVASDEAGLHVRLNDRDLTVAWSSVCAIERRGDGIADGFAKGALLAGSLYLAVGLVSGASFDEVAPFAAGGALAWGTIGAVIDAFNVGRTTVFIRPVDSSGPAGPRGARPTRGFAGGFGVRF
jgi:hypothetical protein